MAPGSKPFHNESPTSGSGGNSEQRQADRCRAGQHRGPVGPGAPPARAVRGFGGRAPCPQSREPQRPRIGRNARACAGGAELRSRARHRVRPVRIHPHPGRAARRVARTRLGQPLGALPGPRTASRAGGPHQPSGSGAEAGRDCTITRHRTGDGAQLVDDVHRATVLNYDSLVVEGDAESFIASDDDGPEDTLLDRERKAYLMDAVGALPERLRRVVIGYFFEERSMQDLADELGVSESRISQLRAEALLLLRDGVNSQLEPDSVPAETVPTDDSTPQGELLRRGCRRFRLSHAVVGTPDRRRRSRRVHHPAYRCRERVRHEVEILRDIPQIRGVPTDQTTAGG